jgi:hypothetical protein
VLKGDRKRKKKNMKQGQETSEHVCPKDNCSQAPLALHEYLIFHLPFAASRFSHECDELA